MLFVAFSNITQLRGTFLKGNRNVNGKIITQTANSTSGRHDKILGGVQPCETIERNLKCESDCIANV